MSALTALDGIDPAHADKLRQAGIRSTRHLLEHGQTEADQQTLSRLTGLPREQIEHWTRLADLFRIQGVGNEYARLLTAAGVGSVFELALREPVRLRQEITAHNLEMKLVQTLPSERTVLHWVEQARNMVRIIGY